jgi:predicted DNA-binding transcriptional regulator AlpA
MDMGILTTRRSATAIPKYKAEISYNQLPDQALLKRPEVCRLCAISPATLDRRVRERLFPQPVYHGRDRLFRWGDVRRHLDLIAEQREPVYPAPQPNPRRDNG